ncbi:MAG TPA: acetyl ornithine aminotransferase family protein [Planctomycetota bacterium]|nr:acetyl ornithine aminotransferase family protein [Planctomycetota bacterium]
MADPKVAVFTGPEIKTALPGPKAKKVLAKDKQFVSPSYTRDYPFVIDRGQDVWVWDVDDNRFLDFTAGVAVTNLGHSHPEVLKVIADQSKRFLHMAGTDFYYEVLAQLSEKLARIAPGDFPKKVFLVNSGTEAIEAALKLARYATGRPRFISFIGAFHGRTMGSLALTASKAVQRQGFSPLMGEVTHVPYAYCYRCVYNLEPKSCAMACANFIEEWIFTKVAPPSDVAAIVVEPIQGEGGYVVPPVEFLRTLRQICDRHKILLITDEIQSGMGRTGKMFASEHSGVIPDIVCVAKALANGFPLGAMIARADLHTWGPGAHANTFGGNPVACAVALKVLEIIEKSLMKNASTVGGYLGEKLAALAKKHDVIGEHRGIGLMQAVEIVESKKFKKADPALRGKLIERCFEEGLLLLGCGPSSIRFIPPLTVTRAQVDVAMAIFEGALAKA